MSAKLLKVLFAYWKAKRLKFKTREQLEHYQAAQLRDFLDWTVNKSPYYRRFAEAGVHLRDLAPAPALDQFPVMNKEAMMAYFDDLNTAGLALDDIMALAKDAEASRDFQGTLRGHTVGLSSGTSEVRGAFVVSDAEKAQWAGVMLAKMLPAGLFAGERVALFLRADSGLYQTVKSPWLTFRFFDLLGDFETSAQALAAYQPTILIAPAQVLRELALMEGLGVAPKKVISVAEVLEDRDRLVIEQAFGPVHQVYQATEGFLASTCEHGTLHLNEEYVHVEPEWLDEEQRRFIPVITDFTRTTQPFIRYRLNDVLVAKHDACPCGRVTRAIERVEGRCDDLLLLPGKNNQLVPVFADALHRVLATALPREADYRLIQTGVDVLRLHADVPPAMLSVIIERVDAALANMGVAVGMLSWDGSTTVPPFNPAIKRRRITRQYQPEAH